MPRRSLVTSCTSMAALISAAGNRKEFCHGDRFNDRRGIGWAGHALGAYLMNSVLVLAFALGMRHGVDPDHLTAIDGLSRVRPRRTNGLYFTIGHGLVVTALAAGFGRGISGRAAFLGP